MSESNAVARWQTEHGQFVRLLGLLEAQVAAFHEGESPDYELLHDIVSYLREVPDRSHHPREDVAFECLVRHEPGLRLPINRLLQEHRVIAVAGDELLARLEEVSGGAVIERATLEAAAATYLAYYRHHLEREDREILPRADRLLTEPDWGLVAQAAPSEPDPLFGPSTQQQYSELRELLADPPDPAP